MAAATATRSRRGAGPALAIADDPATRHGERVARVLHSDTPVLWIVPTLRLAADLLATSARVVALPLRVRGAHLDDPFTITLLEAIERLQARGCRVFVARGSHPNLLAEAGTRIVATDGGPYTTASEACVAAAQAAWLCSEQAGENVNG